MEALFAKHGITGENKEKYQEAGFNDDILESKTQSEFTKKMYAAYGKINSSIPADSVDTRVIPLQFGDDLSGESETSQRAHRRHFFMEDVLKHADKLNGGGKLKRTKRTKRTKRIKQSGGAWMYCKNCACGRPCGRPVVKTCVNEAMTPRWCEVCGADDTVAQWASIDSNGLADWNKRCQK